MMWIKIAFSTTFLETLNICFASRSTSSGPSRTQARSSGLESDLIWYHGKAVHPSQPHWRQR